MTSFNKQLNIRGSEQKLMNTWDATISFAKLVSTNFTRLKCLVCKEQELGDVV